MNGAVFVIAIKHKVRVLNTTIYYSLLNHFYNNIYFKETAIVQVLYRIL